nr:ribonuclease H-like domain-containing protein [Tanacetum cinerariifolium]
MTGSDSPTLNTPLSDKLALVTQLCASYEVDKYLCSPINKTSACSLAPLTPEETKVDKIMLTWILFTLFDFLRARIVVARPKSAKDAWSLISDIVEDNKKSCPNLDARVNEEDLVHCALEGLLDTYNQVCGYMHWKDTLPDLKVVRSLLIVEEMRLNQKCLLRLWILPLLWLLWPAQATIHVLLLRLKGRGTSENSTNDLLNKLLAQLGKLGMNMSHTADGTLSRYKARLVANGSTQLEGVNVDETFSPVVKPGTIRTVLSLAASRHCPVHQLDVKNAFLHGDLSETVYMHQPLGFRESTHPDYVCLLQRSLYGLKQASRTWFYRFASYITRVGFHHSRCDNSLFIFHQGKDTTYLLLYVDDIVLTASFSDLLHQIISSLHQEFDMTDLGSLNYFLGIFVTQDSSWMFLSQKKYAVEILVWFIAIPVRLLLIPSPSWELQVMWFLI